MHSTLHHLCVDMMMFGEVSVEMCQEWQTVPLQTAVTDTCILCPDSVHVYLCSPGFYTVQIVSNTKPSITQLQMQFVMHLVTWNI